MVTLKWDTFAPPLTGESNLFLYKKHPWPFLIGPTSLEVWVRWDAENIYKGRLHHTKTEKKCQVDGNIWQLLLQLFVLFLTDIFSLGNCKCVQIHCVACVAIKRNLLNSPSLSVQMMPLLLPGSCCRVRNGTYMCQDKDDSCQTATLVGNAQEHITSIRRQMKWSVQVKRQTGMSISWLSQKNKSYFSCLEF